MSNKELSQTGNIDAPLEELCQNAVELVEYARGIAEKQINSIQLMTFYSIGRWIVEVQQNGDARAQYGKQVLKKLSVIMTEKFGRGFSVDNLENMCTLVPVTVNIRRMEIKALKQLSPGFRCRPMWCRLTMSIVSVRMAMNMVGVTAGMTSQRTSGETSCAGQHIREVRRSPKKE